MSPKTPCKVNKYPTLYKVQAECPRAALSIIFMKHKYHYDGKKWQWQKLQMTYGILILTHFNENQKNESLWFLILLARQDQVKPILTWWFENSCCSLHHTLLFLQVQENLISASHKNRWIKLFCKDSDRHDEIIWLSKINKWMKKILLCFHKWGAQFPLVWTDIWVATRWSPCGSPSWTPWTAFPHFCSAYNLHTVTQSPAKTHQ